MKEVNKILCSCGGVPTSVDPTETEEKVYGCNQRGCCVGALECPNCKTRFTLLYAPPDPDWERE